MRANPIALDTSVVRDLAKHELRHETVWEGLLALKARGHSIHLADGSLVELLQQLWSEKLKWDSWNEIKFCLVRLLDRHEPVLPGGWRLLAGVGISPKRGAKVDANPLNLKASWDRIRNASNRASLFSNRFGKVEPRRLRRVTRRSYDGWIAEFTEAKECALVDIDKTTFEELVTFMKKAVDEGSTNSSGRAVSERLDAYIRVYAHFFRESAKSRAAYNPSNRVGDSFDHELLRYMAVPMYVATCDERTLTSAVQRAKSWQSKWIVGIDALERVANGQSLPPLDWPL